MGKLIRIRDISKKAPRIRDTSPKAERIDPKEVAEALGAEFVGKIPRGCNRSLMAYYFSRKRKLIESKLDGKVEKSGEPEKDTDSGDTKK